MTAMATATAKPDCPRCSECVGQKHHWIESDDVFGPGDPEFTCKHCESKCFGKDGTFPEPDNKPMNEGTCGERFAVIAFLLDRKEQFANSSGYQAFVEELVGEIAEGRHKLKFDEGEYDDMMPRIKRILRAHA